MAYSREKGSILGYVLVGALLVGLLVGSVLLVRHNLARLSSDSSQVAVTGEGDDQLPGATEEGSGAGEQGNEEAARQAEEQKAAAERAAREKAAREQQSTPAPGNAGRVPTTSTAPTSAVPPSTSSGQLPKTGPMEDAAVMVVGGSLMLGATLAYMRSRASA